MTLPQNQYIELCSSLDCKPYKDEILLESFIEHESFVNRSLSERLSASLQILFELLDSDDISTSDIENSLVDYLMIKIDERISQQMDVIIHHPEFQKLESLWRSLYFVVSRSPLQSSIKLEVLDIKQDELAQDFNEAADLTQSFLYHHVYVNEYDTPGGEPYTAIVSPYEFTAKVDDITLLKKIAAVSLAAHCPFIGNIGPNFFYKKSIAQMNAIDDLETYLQRAEYIPWNAFRESEESRYVGLTFLKVLLRPPYSERTSIRQFRYIETIQKSERECLLWGASSFAFASNLINSFHNYGWCVNIRGPETGGKIQNLPVPTDPSTNTLYESFPVETLLSETRELCLANLGFIPLTYYKNTDYACFFSANSTHSPAIFDNLHATANCRINARLPYIFLSTRIAHYLKVLQRETIGSQKSAAELSSELNNWLKTLITKMNHPSPELLATHPLQDGYVEVISLSESPGVYRVNLFATPHFQVEGMDITLNLQTQLPAKQRHTKGD